MISSNLLDQPSNESYKFDAQGQTVTANHSDEYEQRHRAEHSHLSETLKSLPLNPISLKTERCSRSIAGTLNDNVSTGADNISPLSHILPKRMTLSMFDLDENELVPMEKEDQTNLKDEIEEEIIVVTDSDTTPKIQQKVHLANNIVRWLRGPLKTIVTGTLHAVDLCAQKTHIRESVLRAVQHRLAKQKELAIHQQTTDNSSKSAFIEITSDWTLEGENSDKGFSSATKWIHDPQGRRLLLKAQELPFGAFNEWIAYALGKHMGLPVNEVQISVYENELVTLHTDATQDDEKTITLLDLSQEKRDKLMTYPIIGSMDLFDHIIQNVDRNLRNILVTIPKTSDADDDNVPMKIRLIDHSSCFGMGKLNFVSIVATKFHSEHHLSIVKFDPIRKAKQFEEYLTKIPASDRILISETLNRFAATTDEQFDVWLTEMQDLLSSSQHNRIHSILRRQRDIIRRYTIEWGMPDNLYNGKPVEAN